LAEHLKLSPSTVSFVVNGSPVADSIPAATQERVLAAAREFNYRPDFVARSLRGRRTQSIGVLVPQIGEGCAAEVVRGVEDALTKRGYFNLLASHRSQPKQLDECLTSLQERRVDGFILLAARIDRPPGLPTVAVSGHPRIKGVINVVSDEDRAADLVLSHLAELGHERIAFFRGPPANIDSKYRWRAIRMAAKEIGIEILPNLVRETGGVSHDESFYQEGYSQARDLLEAEEELTALFAFNDISAIGAMRAVLDAGLRVPGDVSIVGFDDIQSALISNPSLTTVRQPVREMGARAGQVLLERLRGGAVPEEIVVAPELIARASTGPASR
jgi:LacI family transcriptional regulator